MSCNLPRTTCEADSRIFRVLSWLWMTAAMSYFAFWCGPSCKTAVPKCGRKNIAKTGSRGNIKTPRQSYSCIPVRRASCNAKLGAPRCLCTTAITSFLKLAVFTNVGVPTAVTWSRRPTTITSPPAHMTYAISSLVKPVALSP